MVSFTVIDIQTGCYPDIDNILEFEDWAKNLNHIDIYRFCISEDGKLFLTDEYGNCVVCPKGRFKIKIELSDREAYEYEY